MNRLKTMQAMVEWVLERYPITKDNDRLLIVAIYHLFYGVDTRNITFADVMKDEHLPNFETIRRARQKAQADRPELRGKRDKERLDRQAEYVAFATE